MGILSLTWKLLFSPIFIIGGGVGLVTGSIGRSFWVAGCVLSFWLNMIGLSGSGHNRKSSTPPVSEAIDILAVATDDGFSLLRQVEGPSSPDEMVTEFQSTVLEENSPPLVATSVDTIDEHTNNPPLREEEIDKGNDIQKDEDENGKEMEAESDEEALFQFVPESEQEPNEIQVLVKLPIGERIGRIFPNTATLQSVYELVDSSECLDVGSYSLVNFFPRVVYGQDQLSSTLEELGLHPQTALFVELNS